MKAHAPPRDDMLHDDPEGTGDRSRRACLRGGLALALAGLGAGCAHRAEPVAPAVAGPPASDAPSWEPVHLPGKRPTQYTRSRLHGVESWHAKAERSASMWRQRVRREPDRIGEVEFSWYVPALIDQADLTQADSADSPVRVVFAFDGDRSRLSARNKAMFELANLLTGEPPPFATLMYVWDPRAAREHLLHSARTDRIRYIVAESGTAHLRQWRRYRRHLHRDFVRAYGEPPGPLIGMGYMTDADNTESRAEAWYGDIRLI
jgi:Protein of unknown function (DUF3047)